MVLLLSALVGCGTGGGPGGASNFGSSGVVEEAARIDQSASETWWLSSGGLFEIAGGVGRTIQNELPSDHRWRRAYARSNPSDTDGGAHPQNVFRLLQRRVFGNVRQALQFNVRRTNASASSSRNQSNGIHLLLRYRDADDLYTAGIRVDGVAAIKKKSGGRYSTLAERPIYAGRYDRSANPNLIPQGRWIDLAAEVLDDSDRRVTIRLMIDGNLVLEASDGGVAGRQPERSGLVGIRSDFMDVEFRGYSAEQE